MSDDIMIVLDATRDERFRNNPLVTDEPRIRFYAGAPLVNRDGFRLGTFCIIDGKARSDFSETDAESLKEFAEETVQIMEMRRRLDPVSEAAEAPAVAEDAQVGLFSLVAHEVRSPISTLVTMSEIFADESFGPIGSDRYREYAALLADTAHYAMEITDRMLDLGSLGTGDIALNEAPCGIARIVERAQRYTRTASADHGGVLRIEMAAGDGVLNVDGALVVRMVCNLIENGFKYGPEKSDVLLVCKPADNGEYLFEVSDAGGGIEAGEMTQALEPYGRILDPGHDDPGGLGIGLPLVKRLIEVHGGRLLLSKSPDIGFSATLCFPAYRVLDAEDVKNLVS